MKSHHHYHCGSTFKLTALAVLVIATAQVAFGTSLDDYVAAPDANYSYSLVYAIPGPGFTVYVLDMTSQQWRNSTEVDRTVWQHWLTIVKPDAASASIDFFEGISDKE